MMDTTIYKFPGFLISRTFSTVLIVIVAAFLAVEGSWGFGLFHHWIFVTFIFLILLSLVFVTVKDFKKKSWCTLMCHGGLALVLFAGLLGAAYSTDAQLRLFSDGTRENLACDAEGKVVALPFSLSLEDFTIDYYEDGISPKQYTSVLSVDGKRLETSVNHPCRVGGYRIYQSGYDMYEGRYSILKVVRDPWLPLSALGALLLALSAILGLGHTWRSGKVMIAALALAVVFGVISLARINFGTLVPALRSLWFIPHLIIYMLAYSVMALSVIAGVASLFTERISRQLPEKLLSTASSLMLLGMLCGAVWAQQAWGDYWTWDAKECWAAVTWLLTLAAMHVKGRKAALTFAVMAFLAIQVTWYGVNYLPSSAESLHTYNQKPAD